MTLGNEFSLPDAEPGPASEGQGRPAQPPVIVIEYRNRGVATHLMPPALILLAALAIASYQRKTPAWPLTPHPSPAVNGDVAIASPQPAPAVPVSTEAGAANHVADVPASEAATELASRTRPPSVPNGEITEVGRMPSPFDLVEGEGLRPVEPPAPSTNAPLPPDPAPAPVPAPPPIPATPDPRPAAAPIPAMTNDPSPTDPDTAEEAPNPSKDEILNDIEREAQQKDARRQDLEGLKSNARALLLHEAITKVHSDRAAFREELKRVLAEEGENAGEEIEKLCNRYGKELLPEVKSAYVRLLRTASSRTSRQAKVERMRAVGVPEPLVLDQICREFDTLINTRNGPRSEDEVRVRAARALLAIPVAPLGRKATPASAEPSNPARPLTNALARPAAGFGTRP